MLPLCEELYFVHYSMDGSAGGSVTQADGNTETSHSTDIGKTKGFFPLKTIYSYKPTHMPTSLRLYPKKIKMINIATIAKAQIETPPPPSSIGSLSSGNIDALSSNL